MGHINADYENTSQGPALSWPSERIERAFNLLRAHPGPFRIYPNPMRSDGVFLGQDMPIEPYEGVRGLSGPLSPAVPRTAFTLPYQVPHDVAEHLIARLNMLSVNKPLNEGPTNQGPTNQGPIIVFSGEAEKSGVEKTVLKEWILEALADGAKTSALIVDWVLRIKGVTVTRHYVLICLAALCVERKVGYTGDVESTRLYVFIGEGL